MVCVLGDALLGANTSLSVRKLLAMWCAEGGGCGEWFGVRNGLQEDLLIGRLVVDWLGGL